MRLEQQILEGIQHEKVMAKSIFKKCELIEDLIRQNMVLQQDNQRLEVDRGKRCSQNTPGPAPMQNPAQESN